LDSCWRGAATCCFCCYFNFVYISPRVRQWIMFNINKMLRIKSIVVQVSTLYAHVESMKSLLERETPGSLPRHCVTELSVVMSPFVLCVSIKRPFCPLSGWKQ
jgi:hypothetical protein